jgi:hypothetical protein
MLLYRSLSLDIGNRIMDVCESLKIEYDIWNGQAIAVGDAKKMEIGMREEDWSKVMVPESELIEVGEAPFGATIEIMESNNDDIPASSTYSPTGRFYTIAPPCSIIGRRTCYNQEGVKVQVAPSCMCRIV